MKIRINVEGRSVEGTLADDYSRGLVKLGRIESGLEMLQRPGALRVKVELLNDRIDDSYRAKYGRSPYLRAMLAAGPRSSTIRAVPRD